MKEGGKPVALHCRFAQPKARQTLAPARPATAKIVLRRTLREKPALAAANETDIKVYGEAVLEFENNGRKCGMKFLDSDVKRPLAAVLG